MVWKAIHWSTATGHRHWANCIQRRKENLSDWEAFLISYLHSLFLNETPFSWLQPPSPPGLHSSQLQVSCPSWLGFSSYLLNAAPGFLLRSMAISVRWALFQIAEDPLMKGNRTDNLIWESSGSQGCLKQGYYVATGNSSNLEAWHPESVNLFLGQTSLDIYETEQCG